MKWGALTLLEISHSRGCYLKFTVLLVQRVCSPKRPNTKDPRLCALEAYIAGDTKCHQPMGAGHMTVLQSHGPMGLCVLQWCHLMLACTRRTSHCTRIITLYGALKVDSGLHKVGAMCKSESLPNVSLPGAQVIGTAFELPREFIPPEKGCVSRIKPDNDMFEAGPPLPQGAVTEGSTVSKGGVLKVVKL